MKFADLDLSTSEGAQALYGRIKRAARMVCDDLDDTEPELIAPYRECYDEPWPMPLPRQTGQC